MIDSEFMSFTSNLYIIIIITYSYNNTFPSSPVLTIRRVISPQSELEYIHMPFHCSTIVDRLKGKRTLPPPTFIHAYSLHVFQPIVPKNVMWETEKSVGRRKKNSFRPHIAHQISSHGQWMRDFFFSVSFRCRFFSSSFPIGNSHKFGMPNIN